MPATAVWDSPELPQPVGLSERAGDLRKCAPSVHRAQTCRVAPLVRLSLFGGVTIHAGAREITVASRKARALLAYLVSTPGMEETRDCLVGLFWSETEDAKARASLRQLLHVLRDAFDKEGLAGLSTDKFHVRLDVSLFATDLDCALASADQGDPIETLVNEPRITDTFLRGYDDVDPAFGNWLRIRREGVRQQLIRRLELQLSDAPHQSEASIRIARALLQIDPTHETACQSLMRACVTSGNVGGALAAYKQLWNCLEEDYDIEPSATTQELAVAIKCGRYQPSLPAFNARSARDVAVRAQEIDRVILMAVTLAVAWMTAARKPDALAESAG